MKFGKGKVWAPGAAVAVGVGFLGLETASTKVATQIAKANWDPTAAHYLDA